MKTATGEDLISKYDKILSADDLLFGSPSHPTLGQNTEESGGYDDGSSFTETWNKMFGDQNQSAAGMTNVDTVESPTNFLPSDLIDSLSSLDPYATPGSADTQRFQAPAGPSDGATAISAQAAATTNGQPGARKAAGKPSDGNLSTWLNLFSDLDPLANPDAIGKENEANDAKRSC